MKIETKVVAALKRAFAAFPFEFDDAFRLVRDADPEVARAALWAIIDDPEADLRLKRLASNRLLDDGSFDVQTRLLESLLRHTDPQLRYHGCGLAHESGAAVVPHLHEVLRNDPVPEVRSMAAYALGAIGGSETIPVLESTVQCDPGADWEGRTVKEEALKALSLIKERVYGGKSDR